MIAIGGNALLKRGEVLSAENQRQNMARSAQALSKVISGNEVALVHGNGPQVGLLALEGEAFKEVPAYPLDVLGAESQGMIGYLIAQEMRNVMPDRRIAALTTQTIVSADDPAFHAPSKPIGPVYRQAEANRLAAERGWVIAADGDGFRRVVPSPRPVDVLELSIVEGLLAAGVLVICAGGGGVPVIEGDDGRIRGVEAVIDKDLTASLLAQRMNAESLIILTDIDGVYRDWGTSAQHKIDAISVSSLRKLSFVDGSMGPKVEAACQFVEATGRTALIGALDQVEDIASGRAGTRVTADELRERG